MIPQELHPRVLLQAYAQGLFPMADERGRLSWYSPDPRAIIPLDGLKISRSLRQRLRRQTPVIRISSCFSAVIRACADRHGGTWISPEILAAYEQLHALGFAHSVEVFYDEQLAGGLYGVTIGGAFFGESMFTRLTDGSKVALVALVEQMRERGLVLLDTQFNTPHLARMGAVEIPRRQYLQLLEQALQRDVHFT
ncbi:MAG: Leucyl/phenylalanyl-tRNA--protein transferase [Phycisphaerae bacterium]|nr:Leucyl/phenylalanyl-tRNA--protein transferase [Phycisphaerae bacterium]